MFLQGRIFHLYQTETVADQSKGRRHLHLANWSLPSRAGGCLMIDSNVLSGHIVCRGQCLETVKQSKNDNLAESSVLNYFSMPKSDRIQV